MLQFLRIYQNHSSNSGYGWLLQVHFVDELQFFQYYGESSERKEMLILHNQRLLTNSCPEIARVGPGLICLLMCDTDQVIETCSNGEDTYHLWISAPEIPALLHTWSYKPEVKIRCSWLQEFQLEKEEFWGRSPESLHVYSWCKSHHLTSKTISMRESFRWVWETLDPCSERYVQLKGMVQGLNQY